MVTIYNSQDFVELLKYAASLYRYNTLFTCWRLFTSTLFSVIPKISIQLILRSSEIILETSVVMLCQFMRKFAMRFRSCCSIITACRKKDLEIWRSGFQIPPETQIFFSEENMLHETYNNCLNIYPSKKQKCLGPRKIYIDMKHSLPTICTCFRISYQRQTTIGDRSY